MSDLWAWLFGLLAFIPGLGPPPEPVYTGYLEADYVYAAPVSAGRIASLPVKEGQVVRAGDVLAVLATDQQEAALRGAEARVEAADATWRNLVTGSRAQEIDVTRAALTKAKADLALAQSNFDRSQNLFERGVIAQAKVDQDRSSLASAQAQVDQIEAQLQVAELPARDAQQVAAEADLNAAQADADKARADLSDRTITAPIDGRIERLYFSLGEMLPLGTPLLSILPEGRLKAKFYIGEADRAAFALGDEVEISCDGCATGLRGTLTFLASDPQTTPPIIYSRHERSRLVFLAEAELAEPGKLLPGQPVTVRRLP